MKNLKARLVRLSERAGTRVRGVYKWNLSEKSNTKSERGSDRPGGVRGESSSPTRCSTTIRRKRLKRSSPMSWDITSTVIILKSIGRTGYCDPGMGISGGRISSYMLRLIAGICSSASLISRTCHC
jgi:hypothetical protein